MMTTEKFEALYHETFATMTAEWGDKLDKMVREVNPHDSDAQVAQTVENILRMWTAQKVRL